jgi:DNA-binding NtrC family response regulator
MKNTVLIVEDEFIVADDLKLTLESAGYHVLGIAKTVKDAREKIFQERPGMVLLDIILKGKINGIELAKDLKKDNIPFIYLSANSNQLILEEAKATEPDGFLVKPFREKDLLITLDIARYRHEHSLESKLRKESTLHELLSRILKAQSGWEQKLLELAKTWQAFTPFDYLAITFKTPQDYRFTILSFLRIGFDEYQTIGIHELSMISGLKTGEIHSLLSNYPQDSAAGWYNEDDFRTLCKSHPITALIARTFGLSSHLVFPLLSKDRYNFFLNFYSRKRDGYNPGHLVLLSHLHSALTAILDSIPASEKKSAFSMPLTPPVMDNYLERKSNANFEGIIGSSAPLLNVLDQLTQVAPLDTSVLILGESGTGKERIADCIHELSPRKNKPFIKINCAALPHSLIETELFGHEKGAFTGAMDKRIGKFELADQGTIFLDEIGDMPMKLQVKLLRVLQEKEIERVGGQHPIKVNVRVLAATNLNLEREVSEGRFRLDLYYRLNVFPLQLPPLRERKEDIRQLAAFFAAGFCRKINKPLAGISPQMLSELESYDWPGNIRELENIMEQSVILNDGRSALTLKRPLQNPLTKRKDTTEKGDQPFTLRTLDDFKDVQQQNEREYICFILKKANGRIRGKGGAAELLNEKPTTLETRMAKLGIQKKDIL